jgi:hypothetical protein
VDGREWPEQGARAAVRLAGTPRLVLLSMAGLRAAGLAARLPASFRRSGVCAAHANAHLLTVAGAAQLRRAAVPGAPAVSRFTEGTAFGTINARKSSPGEAARDTSVRAIGHRVRCYDSGMLEDFDLLAAKVAELSRLVQSLRTENQQLRAQLTAATLELDTMRGRVDEASRRLDLLMERLPTPPNTAGVPWNT